MAAVIVTDEVMVLFRKSASNFKQTSTRLGDGTWRVPVSPEALAGIHAARLPGETESDTIIRYLRAATGAKPN